MAPPAPDDATGVVDLPTLARQGTAGTAWAYGGDDLNANLLVLDDGEGVGEHVNDAVDVLLVGVLGEGDVAIDGRRHRLTAGHLLVVPKGVRRSIAGRGGRFAYLTCHRRRGGLWPEGVPRPDTDVGRAGHDGSGQGARPDAR